MSEGPLIPTDVPVVVQSPLLGDARASTAQSDSPPPRADLDADAAYGARSYVPAAPIGNKDEPVITTTDAAPRRAHSLDALRGLFLILMTLGFSISEVNFPAWMYHIQQPPPTYETIDVPGISWRDLAYVAFLFTMAAALPLTLSRRIAKGETEIGTMFAVIRRYWMLIVYALLIGHASWTTFSYTREGARISIVGFVIMALIYTRRRPDWNEQKFRILTAIGWLAAVGFLVLSPRAYDGTFSFARNDDIIRGLAFASLAGSITWYFTRDRLQIRLVILVGVLALYLGAHGEGWITSWWWNSPFRWLMTPADLSLLIVVIPGTIAGDALYRWMHAMPKLDNAIGWPRERAVVLAFLCVATTPVVVVGLYHRWVFGTTQLVIAILIGCWFLTWRPNSSTEKLLRQLFLWGALWLMLGLLLEPSEDGIRKVPETLSYLFTVTGLTTLLLVAFSVATAGAEVPYWLRPFRDVGVNPLLCYVLYEAFLNPLLGMIPWFDTALRGTLSQSLVRSVLTTVAIVLLVQAATRARIYWRT